MKALIFVTVAACLISLGFDREKTGLALKKAVKKSAVIFIPFVWMVFGVSVALYLIDDQLLASLFSGRDPWLTIPTGIITGSVLMMPGAIAFPLSGLLLEKGASPSVIAGFTASLMMVGILTLGIEKQYLGTKVALIRNGGGLLTAVLVAIVVGWVLGW